MDSPQIIPGGNLLFPVFLRLDKLNLLVVGAGEVGWEKLSYMFKHASNAQVTVVAPEIREEIRGLAAQFPGQIKLIERGFKPKDLRKKDIAIAATADRVLNGQVVRLAKKKGVLVNAADMPDLCDFYLSSVVKKGDLKLAISSNGKSPTMTKRLREFFEEVLPEDLDQTIANLEALRASLKGDFQEKVRALNEATAKFTPDQPSQS